MTLNELKEYVIGKTYSTKIFKSSIYYTITFRSPHYLDFGIVWTDLGNTCDTYFYDIKESGKIASLTLHNENSNIVTNLSGIFEGKDIIRIISKDDDLIFTLNGKDSQEHHSDDNENKPSTMSYTLAGQFNYITESPTEFPVIDSLYYNKYIMLDNYSALCTSCDDVNSGFSGGWKVSLKKGSSEDTPDLQIFSSAGKHAGLTSETNGNLSDKAYAVFSYPSQSTYDIVFNYKNYFTKSSCMVQGFYINNTKYVETLANEGKIADGDFLKVSASFYKNDAKVCEEEFYLVDYTGAEKKIVKDWTAWEMKTATTFDVDAVKFSVTTSNGTLPQNFCLDLLEALITVEY